MDKSKKILAISSTFLTASAFSAGVYTPEFSNNGFGDAGASTFTKGDVVPLIGEIKISNPWVNQQVGSISSQSIVVNNSEISGAPGLQARYQTGFGAGSGGLGGATVAGGLYMGVIDNPMGGSSNTKMGGVAGKIYNNVISIDGSKLIGGKGGNGSIPLHISGEFGNGGNGGGSVYGGISIGGNGGFNIIDEPNLGDFSLNLGGGGGGDIFGNSISINNSYLFGGDAGDAAEKLLDGPGAQGGSTLGAGGYGGGSVFGGFSMGGNSGAILQATNKQNYKGGAGGDIYQNVVNISNTEIIGGSGGDGGTMTSISNSVNPVIAGRGGAGGGSVFGGVSIGGVGGSSVMNIYSSSVITAAFVDGGDGGDVYLNRIYLNNVKLTQGAAGQGGVGNTASQLIPVNGVAGGSVFGGLSYGGDAGNTEPSFIEGTANGGDGGDVSKNSVTISGKTEIDGDIYGGYSQGGKKGSALNGQAMDGRGGLTQDNIITLIGNDLTLKGNLYGGYSINGDGKENNDLEYLSYYKGNTLQIKNGRIVSKEIHNFQNYNWLLPKDNFGGDVIINVDAGSTYRVDINNTIHKVDVNADGNVLHAGDKVILINKVTGVTPKLAKSSIEQGFFIVYDAKMDVEAFNGVDALVLTVLGSKDSIPDGKVHPESEELLKGRIAQLAIVDQGADMISDGISYARASLRKENVNIFAIVDGGSNKYKNGGVSTLKLNDFKFALGAAKAWELDSKSVGMIAVFAEHGNANYRSHNNFEYFGEIRGAGSLRYNGLGLMFHMDVASTDKSKVHNKPNIFDDKYGLYLDAALRVGHVKGDFHSADMVNGEGIEASYNTKSRYASAMAGVGYVWTLDEKRALDFYGRFTFSRMNGKDIQVVDEQMYAGAAHSKRLRLGARYGYAYSATMTPYAGVAFERNFTGDVTGSAYGFTIKETSLKGNTGLVEAGVMIKPKGADDPFSLRLGVQGYFGQRKGATADIRARYVF